MTLILALDFGGTKLAAATVKAGAKEWSDHESR
ncbi:MAG: ROK family protein, partial [Aphanizomenon sp.]